MYVGAALLMAETRTLIRARNGQSGSPAALIAELNRFFYEDLTRAELFVTMFYLEYQPSQQSAIFASAGHSPPLVWRKASATCERLDAEGLILGVRREFPYEEKPLQFASGDMLLLYTDGIIEADNQSGELFGEERLTELLKESCNLQPRELIDRIFAEVRMFSGSYSFSDDVSLVVMRIEETNNST